VGADETSVHIRSSLWADTIGREGMEKAVELIEAGKLSRTAGAFVERLLVTDQRPTSVAHILTDLGHLD
jgi:hypothetical protein